MHFDESRIVRKVLWDSGLYHCVFLLECVFLYCIDFCSTTYKVKLFFFQITDYFEPEGEDGAQTEKQGIGESAVLVEEELAEVD